jgi:predicted DNA-binding transcriptional regulator YafY
VQIWYSPEVARWRLERGTARLLKDGSAIEEVPVGGEEWLIGEILSYRGEAVVLEPTEVRKRVAERARSLLADLGLNRVRVPSAS